ncbi:Auxin-responsive protein SAUR71 [Heracleum sosnowskyi]|uniref:Auxin-responsive protein SAUR71 n=1 Tax=Heracleum sosnowskyi TaxID=360622 RepID=A0AAD8HS28_9APIA|nr:Auxin-responsive protein SAUR71 [Heracleum sosnowskyi]
MSNKIIEIVKLQQIRKKWRKAASLKKCSMQAKGTGGVKSIKFLKKTLSFSDRNTLQGISRDSVVPKGFLAVCVGEEMKRFVIPMTYLRCKAFDILLKEAEEEFGFQQEGILRIPCQVCLFEEIIKLLENNKDADIIHDYVFTACSSLSESLITNSHHPRSPICR